MVFIWGGGRERASCLGHFVSPLLTSVAGTKGEGTAGRGFSPEPGGGHWWLSHWCTALYSGVFANLPLCLTLAMPSVAHRSGFSFHVFLMKEPKWGGGSKWHAGGPSQSAAQSRGGGWFWGPTQGSSHKSSCFLGQAALDRGCQMSFPRDL